MVSKQFLLKRLLLLFPVLFGVATVVFAILHLSPGDPAVTIAGERASQEFINEVRSDLGLDDPLWQQYVRFLGDIAALDFGQSYQIQRGTPVSDILANRLPITIELALLGEFAGLLFGLPLGIGSRSRSNSPCWVSSPDSCSACRSGSSAPSNRTPGRTTSPVSARSAVSASRSTGAGRF